MNRPGLRVGLDIRLAHWPGIGRYIEETVRHLAADHPDTEFVLFGNAEGCGTLRAYEDPRLQQRLQAPNLRFVPCSAAPFSLHDPFALGRAARLQGVHVFHAPYINIPWLPRNGIPLVVTLHDFRHPDLALQAASPRTWAKRAYYEALTRLALARAQRIVCVSEFLAGQLGTFRPALRHRLEVIHHAASDVFRPAPPGVAAAEVARQFGLEGRYLLFVGTLKPHKNLLAVVQALARADVPGDVTLAVAAAPDERYPQVPAAVRRLGLERRVRFLGHVDKRHLSMLYGAAVATLLPSSYESFGLPLVESMACGTPVIAAPSASLPEVGGDAAWYAEPEPAALAAAMRGAVLDEAQRARRRAAGLQRASAFSWKRAAAALHAVYLHAARGGDRAAGRLGQATPS
ncbi:glycosyltransferase family 4 protein [Aquabacterium sp. J223]|uniref:glycosyltransferase family 4 protein n=1 Tax=Aquabacterium sp. J223 TaxID=2898431 RepID=UPI0021AD8BDC|nr:glycosyltransferase family 1 protein [Aquabacterium sp. J223]UUX94792.1 glycosyltransferase family 4 protein [Aquabacterium sp. J223]